MAEFLGDFEAGDTIYGKFTTRQTSGAPIVFAGSAAIATYADATTGENSTGVTLTTNFDSVVGLNHYAIATASNTTVYATGTQHVLVATGGTVNGVTVAGETIARFSLGWFLKPETKGRTLRVGAAHQAEADITAISGDSVAAESLEAMLDGTGGVDLSVRDFVVGRDILVTDDIAVGDDITVAGDMNISGSLIAATALTVNGNNLDASRIDTAISTRLAGASYTAPSTTTQIADGVLDRDMSLGADSGSASVRTARQALRFLRNKWVANGTGLTVFAEDDTTTSWTSILTATASATPITGSDPA